MEDNKFVAESASWWYVWIRQYWLKNKEEMQHVIVERSTRSGKKYQATVDDKIIHFGQEGASDYTLHRDDDRKRAYISRHAKREDWTRSGVHTAGFWSRWITWNQPTLKESINSINTRFKDLRVILKWFLYFDDHWLHFLRRYVIELKRRYATYNAGYTFCRGHRMPHPH